MKDIRKIVVFAHGFGGHKDNGAAEKFAQRLITKHKGSALITFNWPSHGDDVKKALQLEDCTAYLSLVIEHLRRKYQTDELYCYATSFGGYLTLRYIHAQGNPFRKIALRCPAVDMYRILTHTIITESDLAQIRKGKPVPVGFDRKILVPPAFLEELKQQDIRQLDFLDYAEDLLILHGTADEIVPFEDAYSFADDNLIEFIPVDNADHRFRDPQKMEFAIKQILAFFAL